MAAAPPRPLTIYLSLTSSPSTPRAQLIIHPPSDSDINESSNNSTTAIITASELRRRASDITSVPLDSIKLIFRGRVIPEKDAGNVVEEYKLEDGCVVHVMGKPTVDVNAGGGGGGGRIGIGGATHHQPAGATVTMPSANGGMNTTTANNINDTTNASLSATGMLQAAISKLRSSNDSGTYREGLSTAHKLLGNIITNVSFMFRR